MEISYKAEDFTPHGKISKEDIKYVLENVEDFEPRYYLAMVAVEKYRCGLRDAVPDLFYAILDTLAKYKGIYEEIDAYDELFDDVEYVFG